MPAYQNNPSGNNPVGLLQPGIPAFAFGSRNKNLPTVLAAVTSVTADGATATIGVIIREGNIPSVGDPLTTTAIPNNGGVFNVTNAALTAVNITPSTGVGTLSFALAQTVSPAAATGNAYVGVPAVPEAVVNNEASQAFAVPNNSGQNDSERTISMQVTYGTAPSAGVMALQGSLVDNDADYSDLISTSTLTTDLVEITLQNVRFVRAKLTGLTGTPTAVVRIMI